MTYIYIYLFLGALLSSLALGATQDKESFGWEALTFSIRAILWPFIFAYAIGNYLVNHDREEGSNE